MKTMRLLLALVIFISFPLNAQQLEYAGSCKNYESDLYLICLHKEYRLYDKKLNEIYNKFLRASPHEKLKKIQKLWVKYKEEDCKYMAEEVDAGMYYDYIYRICLINQTKTRIHDLQREYGSLDWYVTEERQA